jgi:hypothetical protein
MVMLYLGRPPSVLAFGSKTSGNAKRNGAVTIDADIFSPY